MAGEGKPEVISRVRQARVAAGLKQRELADLTSVSLRAITFMETDPAYVPSVGVALKLARALNCTVEDLFTLAGPDPSLAWIDEQLRVLDAERAALMARRQNLA